MWMTYTKPFRPVSISVHETNAIVVWSKGCGPALAKRSTGSTAGDTAVHHHLLSRRTACVLAPEVTPSALLQLLAWAQITGESGDVVRLNRDGGEAKRWRFAA
ncbi:MAG: hypothetical protein ACI9WU_003619 [Myxococcota bacterium]|jgi:hypothetical protein